MKDASKEHNTDEQRVLMSRADTHLRAGRGRHADELRNVARRKAKMQALEGALQSRRQHTAAPVVLQLLKQTRKVQCPVGTCEP